jgi:PhoH-like ATPase
MAPISRSSEVIKRIYQLIDNKLIEVEALTYVRGPSLPDRSISFDQAKNFSSQEMKTILGRVGASIKLVLAGNA